MDRPPFLPLSGNFVFIVATKVTGTIIEVALRRNNVTSARYESANAALGALRNAPQSQARFSMAFIDLVSPGPGMDGYELIHLLRTLPLFQGTVFVALQNEGKDHIVNQVKARLAGRDVYLPKPFTSQQIEKLAQQYT